VALQVQDITLWRPGERFALWHDRAVFHFLTEAADRAGYIAALRRALRPGGTLIVATFSLTGPARCSNLPVRRYDAAGLADAFGPEFSLIETATEDHVTPAGAVQNFLYARLVRRME
jgi:hypothetical protein